MTTLNTRRMAGVGALLLVTGVALGASPAKVAAPRPTPELVAKGKVAYTNTCAVCHGEKGDGNGVAGASLNPKPRDLRVKDLKVGAHYKNGGKPEQLFKTISEGLPGTAMVSFGAQSEEDRWAMVYYIQQTFQGVK